MLSKSTRVLQVLFDHGWNINKAEAYCEPPFLGYVVCFPHHPHASPEHRPLLLTPLTKASRPRRIAYPLAPCARRRPQRSQPENGVLRRSLALRAQAPLEIINLLFDRGGSTTNGRLLNRASDPILQCSPDRGVPINDTRLEHRPGLAHWANAGAATTPFHKCGRGRKRRVGDVFSRTVAPIARIGVRFLWGSCLSTRLWAVGIRRRRRFWRKDHRCQHRALAFGPLGDGDTLFVLLEVNAQGGPHPVFG